VLVHGETISESVPPGTNQAALEADVDILAHPGLITEELVTMAKEKGILLEISARRGHSLANGYVAQVANKIGAPLIFNTDAHSPEDLLDSVQAQRICAGAGLSAPAWKTMQDNARNAVTRVFSELERINGDTPY
jgi:histidinol phosphatase-like PHP family hydrolase